MRTIVFVGDKPSNKNLDSSVPFVGTPSYRNLLIWVAKMDIDIRNVELDNANSISIDNYYNNCKFIALGAEAEKKLKNFGRSFFKLPHPSPRNRLLNDKNYIDNQLKKCKIWLSI